MSKKIKIKLTDEEAEELVEKLMEIPFSKWKYSEEFLLSNSFYRMHSRSMGPLRSYSTDTSSGRVVSTNWFEEILGNRHTIVAERCKLTVTSKKHIFTLGKHSSKARTLYGWLEGEYSNIRAAEEESRRERRNDLVKSMLEEL